MLEEKDLDIILYATELAIQNNDNTEKIQSLLELKKNVLAFIRRRDYRYMRKLSKKDIRDMVGWGFSHTLIVCASNQDPTAIESFEITSDFFSDTAHLERWHKKMKDKLCNETNGLSLKYYLKK
jgi:hypothetical protein